MQKKFFTTVILLTCFFVSLLGQEKAPSLINYVPNSNFMVFKIKNAKDLKAIFENHPMKKIIYSEKTRELLDEMLQSLKDEIIGKESDEEDKETKDLTKTLLDKLMVSFNGEAFFTIFMKNAKNDTFDVDQDPSFALIAQVEQESFKELLKAYISLEEKSAIKKVIVKKEYEGVEYYSITTEDNLFSTFTAIINGVAVASSEEETFKKMASALVKKTPIENGLKSNEKFYSYLNANPTKELIFSCDLAPTFKFELAAPVPELKVKAEDDEDEEEDIVDKDDGKSKEFLAALQLDKLFQINASYEFKDKIDNFEVSLNCLDEGALQYLTIVNSEFTPASFISADVSTYTKMFFSLSELKKKLLALLTKLEPEAITQYQEFLKMAKENFQFDLEAFIESIGDENEIFNVIQKDGKEEMLWLNKLKSQVNFITNFASIMNNPLVKLNLGNIFNLVENKENESHFWALTTKSPETIGKDISLSAGTIESYAFISAPSNMTQKQIAQIKKGSESKLSSLPAYNTARALFPAKIGLFSFSATKDMYTSFKTKILEQYSAMILEGDEESEPAKFIKLLDGIDAEDFKGNLSFGLWKEKNKLLFSLKLINK